MKKARFTSGIGAIVLFFACITLAVAGLTISLKPTPRPIILGWIYLLVSLSLAGFTAQIWRRVLPGILACGALNASYMAVSGHAIGQTARQVSLASAAALFALFLAMAVLTAKGARKASAIDLIDRAAYGAIFLALAAAFAFDRAAIAALAGMLVTVTFLALRRTR